MLPLQSFRIIAAVAALAGAAGCSLVAPHESAGFHMLVGEVAAERGEYVRAADEYRLAAAETGDAKVAERAARIAFDHGQDTELERIAREWLGRDPKSEQALRFDAVALLQLDRRGEAAAQFATLIGTAYPTPGDAFTALGESLAELRNDTGAARTIGILAARYPDVPQAAYAHAALALSAGDSPTALTEVTRALSLKPGWREARWLEVRALIAGGECNRGLIEAGALSAESTDADRLLYAWLLSACDRQAEAKPFFEDLAHGGVARAEALEGLAGIELDQRRWDEATNHYTEMLATGRNMERAFYGLAIVADRRGDASRAIRLYTRVASGPRAVPAQLRAYRLLLQQGQPGLAGRTLDDFVASVPEDRVTVTAGRAQILSEFGRSREALELLERAELSYPDREEFRYAHAEVLERQGQVARAIAELRGLARTRPDDATAQNALGFTLAEHDQALAEAETHIRTALAVRPDSPAIRDSLGWVLYRRGRAADALEWLQKAYANDPDPEIAAHLGAAQWSNGDREGAQKTWHEALERSPGDPHLKQALEQHPGSQP